MHTAAANRGDGVWPRVALATANTFCWNWMWIVEEREWRRKEISGWLGYLLAARRHTVKMMVMVFFFPA